MGEHVYVLALSCAELPRLHLQSQISERVDVVELRADALDVLSPAQLRKQISIARLCELPLMLTLRSEGLGGAFSGSDEQYAHLLELAVRAGCEWLDIEKARFERCERV